MGFLGKGGKQIGRERGRWNESLPSDFECRFGVGVLVRFQEPSVGESNLM